MIDKFKPLYLFAWTVIAEAKNTKTIISVCLIYVAAIAIAVFVGEISITETRQSQVAISAAFLRLSLLFFISLFTINSIVRDINDRMLLLYMSLPISRLVFVLGKFIGFALIGIVLAFIASLVVFIFTDISSAFIWGGSLILESWIIIAFSLLCAFSFAHITSSFSAVMAIYLLSRSLSSILLMAQNPFRGIDDSASQQFSQFFLTAIDYLLPKLDQFTRTEWLIYNDISASDIYFIIQQTVIYLLLLLSATFIDFYRKNL